MAFSLLGLPLTLFCSIHLYYNRAEERDRPTFIPSVSLQNKFLPLCPGSVSSLSPRRQKEFFQSCFGARYINFIRLFLSMQAWYQGQNWSSRNEANFPITHTQKAVDELFSPDHFLRLFFSKVHSDRCPPAERSKPLPLSPLSACVCVSVPLRRRRRRRRIPPLLNSRGERGRLPLRDSRCEVAFTYGTSGGGGGVKKSPTRLHLKA